MSFSTQQAQDHALLFLSNHSIRDAKHFGLDLLDSTHAAGGIVLASVNSLSSESPTALQDPKSILTLVDEKVTVKPLNVSSFLPFHSNGKYDFYTSM